MRLFLFLGIWVINNANAEMLEVKYNKLLPGLKIFHYPSYPSLYLNRENNCQERVSSPYFEELGIQCLCDNYEGDAKGEDYAYKTYERGVTSRCMEPSKWLELKQEQEQEQQRNEKLSAEKKRREEAEAERQRKAEVASAEEAWERCLRDGTVGLCEYAGDIWYGTIPESKVNPMTIRLRVRNNLLFAIKDIQFDCAQYGPSGTQIKSSNITIYEIWNRGQTKEVSISSYKHDQFASFRCRVAKWSSYKK